MPSFVQASARQDVPPGNTSWPVTLTVTAGNQLTLLLTAASGSRHFTPHDSQGNTWVEVDEYEGPVTGCMVGIYRAASVAAGSTTVTLVVDAGTFTGLTSFVVVESSGTSSTPDDATSHFEGTSDTAHVASADATVIDTSANGSIVFVVGCTAAIATACTNGTGWTLIDFTDQFLFQYKTASGALANEQGEWTSGIARASVSAIASFKAAPAVASTTDGLIIFRAS